MCFPYSPHYPLEFEQSQRVLLVLLVVPDRRLSLTQETMRKTQHISEIIVKFWSCIFESVDMGVQFEDMLVILRFKLWISIA